MNTVIAICGDSGSGKTTLSNFLCEHLVNCVVLECDRYHRWERGDFHWKYLSPLNILSNDTDSMIKDVELLKRGEAVKQRDYDHSNGKFTEPELIEPQDYILVVGLHSIKVNADVNIFLDTQQDLKYIWKINRDFKERGHSVDSIIDSIKNREIDFPESHSAIEGTGRYYRNKLLGWKTKTKH